MVIVVVSKLIEKKTAQMPRRIMPTGDLPDLFSHDFVFQFSTVTFNLLVILEHPQGLLWFISILN